MSGKDRISDGSVPGLATLKRWVTRLRRHLAPEPQWVRERNRSDRAFDEKFRVDTGFEPISTLRVDSAHRAFAVDHLASDLGELEAALGSVSAPWTWTFVDLGSGKGRAVLMASLRPFRRIVGVEFAPELHEVALKNLSRFSVAEQRCTRIELHRGDAATHELPPEDTLLFMYNPFGPEVMAKVVARTVASLRLHPRRLLVLYSNPLHAEAWYEAGFKIQMQDVRNNFLLLACPGMKYPTEQETGP